MCLRTPIISQMAPKEKLASRLLLLPEIQCFLQKQSGWKSFHASLKIQII